MTEPEEGDLFPTVFDDANALTFSPDTASLTSASRMLRGCINYGLITGHRIFCSDSWLSRNPALCELWLGSEDDLSLLAREGVLVLARRSGASLLDVHEALTKRTGPPRHPNAERQVQFVRRSSAFYEDDAAVWEYELQQLAIPFDSAVRAWYDRFLASASTEVAALVGDAWKLALERSGSDPVRASNGQAVMNAEGESCLAARHLYVFDPHSYPTHHAKFQSLRSTIEDSVRRVYREALPRHAGGRLTALSFVEDLNISNAARAAWSPTAVDAMEDKEVPDLLTRPEQIVMALADWRCADVLKARSKIADLHNTAVLALHNDSPMLGEVLDEYVPHLIEQLVAIRAIDPESWKGRAFWTRQRVKTARRGLFLAGAGFNLAGRPIVGIPLLVIDRILGDAQNSKEVKVAEAVATEHEREVRTSLRVLHAGSTKSFLSR